MRVAARKRRSGEFGSGGLGSMGSGELGLGESESGGLGSGGLRSGKLRLGGRGRGVWSGRLDRGGGWDGEGLGWGQESWGPRS